MRCDAARYATTLHLINSTIVKMSQLTRVQTVYCGLAHATLPDRLVHKDEANVAGGVDFAFRSTSTERGVAVSYTKGASVKVVFEIQQGLIDRGADLSEVAFLLWRPHMLC